MYKRQLSPLFKATYPISSTEFVLEVSSREAFRTTVAGVEVLVESTIVKVVASTFAKSGSRTAVPAADGSLITPLTIPSLSPYPPSTSSRCTASAIPSPLVSKNFAPAFFIGS